MTVLGGFPHVRRPDRRAPSPSPISKTYAVGFTVYWQLLLGTVLVVLVLALPTGIMGAVGQLASAVNANGLT